jgi:hypothetical protein
MRVRRFERDAFVGGRRDGRELRVRIGVCVRVRIELGFELGFELRLERRKQRWGERRRKRQQRRRNLRRLHDRRAVHRLRLPSEGKLVLLPGGRRQLLPEAGVHVPGRLEQRRRKREQQRQWKRREQRREQRKQQRRDQHVRQLHQRSAMPAHVSRRAGRGHELLRGQRGHLLRGRSRDVSRASGRVDGVSEPGPPRAATAVGRPRRTRKEQ